MSQIITMDHLRKIFVEKLLKTGSFDAAFKKVCWHTFCITLLLSSNEEITTLAKELSDGKDHNTGRDQEAEDDSSSYEKSTD